ncbi:isopenicillin N synthase family oxygenase [Methylocapsa sp. S129]|uniref:isopenicillin N synthase family dioxygenase n=1 Tax=Methylocapsa sp. S129 TaxID=1641869 RepID=UPI00131B7192|nr:2-oxoglutarate and iron-dependent oxygenase domain-containing protein [Methylocapsa sp. S129]
MTNEPAPRAGRLDEIPIIDLADADVRAVAQKVRHACENSAFFYIANHGVSRAVIDGAFAEARRFFSLPLDEKMKVYKSKFHRGYLPLGTTQYPGQKKDLKDSFDFGVDLPLDDPDVAAGLPLHGPNQWPDLPGFREALEAYFEGVRAAGIKLTRVLAVSLDLEEDYFAKLYTKPSILARVIHYPMPEPGQESDFGVGALAHTDYGHITILAPDPAGGLEIQLPGGEWIAAPFVPDTFVVNLGDLMARWTNDVYRSNFHRVVNRLNRDRMSIPIFMNPNHRAEVACIPTCTGPGRPPKYEPVLAGDYVVNKIRANQGLKT